MGALARSPELAPELNHQGENRPIRVSFFTVRAGEGHIQIMKSLLEHVQGLEYASRFKVISHPVPAGGISSPSSLDYVLLNHYLTKLQEKIWGAYTTIGLHHPALWGPLYNGAGHTPEPIMRESLRGYLGAALIEELNRGDPDVIVAFNPILARVVNVMKEMGLIDLRTRVVQVVTDFTVMGLYKTEGLTIVPHSSPRDALVKMGKSPELIHVVNGLPARPAFLKSLDPIQARKFIDDHFTEILKEKFSQASLSWPYPAPSVLDSAGDSSTPLIVIMGGGEGMGIQKIVDFLPSWNPSRKINVIIVAGRSEGLFNNLMQLTQGKKLHPNLNLVPVGFTDRISDIYQAATLLISKPGGSTLAESEATELPLFVHTYIPGQESANFELNQEMGTAQHLSLSDLNQIDALIARSHEIRLALGRHFPDAKKVPARTVSLIEDYVRAPLSQYPEQLEIEKRMALKPLSFAQRLTSATCLQHLVLPH